MNKERELLSRALVYLSGLPAKTYIQDDIEAYLSTTSDDAEEPVAWGYKDRWGYISDCISCQSAKDAGTKGDFTIPLYLHPPKPAESARKPWQGLDEDEIEEILEGFPMGTYSEQAFAQAIEQELKEKNT